MISLSRSSWQAGKGTGCQSSHKQHSSVFHQVSDGEMASRAGRSTANATLTNQITKMDPYPRAVVFIVHNAMSWLLWTTTCPELWIIKTDFRNTGNGDVGWSIINNYDSFPSGWNCEGGELKPPEKNEHIERESADESTQSHRRRNNEEQTSACSIELNI